MMLKAFFNQLFDYIGKIGVSFTIVATIALSLKNEVSVNAIPLLFFGSFLIIFSAIVLSITKKE